MPTTLVVDVQLPRVVEGVLGRGRGPIELHPVFDAVPLGLVSLTADEAPLALRSRPLAPSKAPHEWREWEGRLYSPLMPFPEEAHKRRRRPLEPLEPRHLHAYVHAEIQEGIRHVGTPNVTDRPILGEWAKPLRQLRSMREAFVEPGTLRVTGDDGTAQQSAFRARLETNLVVIDGVLHHRARPPYVSVHGSSLDVRVGETIPAPWPVTDRPPPLSWKDFPPHRSDEAERYGRHLAAEQGCPFSKTGIWSFEVVDADALARAYGPSPSRVASLCSSDVAEGMADRLRNFGDAEVMAWLRLRAGGRGPAETCADIDVIRLACEAFPKEPPADADPRAFWAARTDMNQILATTRNVLGRLAFEHGAGVLLSEEDNAALEAFTP